MPELHKLNNGKICNGVNTFNNPVIKDKFFAREKELNFLYKKVEDLKKGYRHNVAILGKRLRGKTSILLHFLSTIDNSNIIPVYVDLSMLSFTAFLDQFIGMLLRYHYNGKTEIKNDLQLLIETASSDLPKTYKKIKTAYSYIKAAKFDLAFSELLDLPTCFSQETGKFCLIVIDNFEEFDNYALTQAFSVLGDRIMLQKMSLYVLSGRSNINSKNIVSEKLSLLFGKFQTLELEPFSYEEAMAFINLRCNNIELPVDIKKFLISFSNGEPFYLDTLTDSIFKEMRDENISEVGEEDFYYILYESIFAPYSPMNQHFSRIIERFSDVGDPKASVRILNALLTENKLSAIITSSKCPKDTVHKLLEKFISCEMVVKNGPLYTIEDEIFKTWLKLKEDEYTAHFELERASYIKRLIAKIKEVIDAFKKEQQKQIDDKILNLISAFDNEKITVGNRTHILPPFKHINSELLNSENILVSAHGTKMWVFSVFKQLAAEDDILNFINYCKQKRHRVSRKILIILNGITPEAKLLAMEAHMWIWPLDKLNNLFNLYRKNKIFYENSSIG